MLATIVFQVLAAGGMALIGWWLYFDDDTPGTVKGQRQNQPTLDPVRHRRSAA